MTVKGLVLSQKPFSEQDKFIDILTDNGILEILVKGSAKVTSKSGSASQLFAYSEFDISDHHAKNKARILTQVTPINIFYGLRNNLNAVALASYFAQVILYAALPKSATPEILRLTLNCLHYLSQPEQDELLVKAIFELRIASLLGFQPDVVMCRKCGNYLPENLYFSVENGCFYCESCNQEGIFMPAGTLQAVRFVILQDFEKIFSFRISENCRKPFFDFAEQFLQYHVDKKFPALEYYTAIRRSFDASR